MAEKVQDKKIQKHPPGKGNNPANPSGSSQKPGGDKGSHDNNPQKKGNDGKKKW
jgi:hypothetical protein